MSMAGFVYVEAVPGIGAIRIGRTVDLPQRLRWFEYTHLRVEVILLGCCVAEEDAERAEARIFDLLDEIHLRRHDPQLYGLLPTYDWYLPDRRMILYSFLSLCRGEHPLFTHVQRAPLFERLTKLYPDYATPNQILHVLD